MPTVIIDASFYSDKKSNVMRLFFFFWGGGVNVIFSEMLSFLIFIVLLNLLIY